MFTPSKPESDIFIFTACGTFAKIVSEYSESMAETQEALGHSNIKTTQIYVQRLAVKKDKHSKSIRDALKK